MERKQNVDATGEANRKQIMSSLNYAKSVKILVGWDGLIVEVSEWATLHHL